MKKLVLLLLITVIGQFLAAQSTFCKAQAIAENQQSYWQKVAKIRQQKAELLKAYQNNPNPFIQQTRLFYGGKLGEATIDNILLFLESPFSLKVQQPLDFELFELLIDGEVANNLKIIYPFLDETNKAILIPNDAIDEDFQLNPIYTFNAEQKQFYQNDEPLVYYQPNNTYNPSREFTPSEDEEIFALYNPASGEFHASTDDFFSTTPIAKWSPINNRIYLTGPSNSATRKYDFKDNRSYATETDILVLFKNKTTGENRVASIGSNVIGGGTDSEMDFSRAVITSSGQKTVLTNPVLSNPLPSIVTDALAQFLVKRTKEELTLAFFDQFRKKIEASNEFQTLLPNTNFLLQTQKDVFRIPSMGTVWVESFQSDIQNLVSNLERLLLTDPNYQPLLDQPTVQAFQLAFNLVDLTRQGEAPLNILATLKDRVQNNYQIGGLHETLDLLQLLGQELQSCETENSGYLLTPNELQTLSPKHKAYFISLLFRKNQAGLIPLFGQFTNDDYLPILAENQSEFFNMMVQLAQVLQDLEGAGQQYRINGTNPDYRDQSFENITKKAVSLLEFSFRLKYFSNPYAYFQSEFYQTYYPIILNTINALGHVERQEYGIFLINLAQILQPIIDNKINTNPTEESERLANFMKDFLFYGGFMVDILSALDAETISGIIQQYALPVGSYRIKRRAHFSMDINAYPGLYMGVESGLNNTLKGDGVVGVTAPIGLTTSWGNFKEKEGQSFSLFFPIIDIGAAFSYRWGNSFGGFPDKLTWRQILSPGVHAVYGFKELPISLMVGAQFMPELRGISENGFTDTGRSVWHFGVSGVVDIPMFNLHVQEQKRIDFAN